jgi:hypothetical protein
MPSFHAPSSAHFSGMSFHEPAPSFHPSFRYTPSQASEHFSRAPQMAMPNEFNGAARSSGYAPSSERYAAPSERYSAPSERYSAPSERYSAPSERYVPPGSYSNVGFQQNERLQTQQFESTPANYHSAYYGNHTNSPVSENFEVHGNRITRPATSFDNMESQSNYGSYNNQAVKSAEVAAEESKHSGQIAAIGGAPGTSFGMTTQEQNQQLTAEAWAQRHSGLVPGVAPAGSIPTQQAGLPSTSTVPGVTPGTQMPSSAYNNPYYNGYLNSNNNGFGNGFGYGSYGSYGSGYGYNPFGSGYGGYNPGYGYNPFGSGYGSGYGYNPFGGYGSGYGYGSGSGMFGMLGSLFGMGGYGNGYGNGYGGYGGYGNGFGGYGGYGNGLGGYGYPGSFGNYGNYGNYGGYGGYGYPGQNFFANNGYPNTTMYANGFPGYNSGVAPSTIPSTIGTQPNGLPVNPVAQGVPKVPSIMPSASAINPATWNAIHHGVLGTALAQNALRKATGSTSAASLGALTRSAAHQQASFATAAAAAARAKRR